MYTVYESYLYCIVFITFHFSFHFGKLVSHMITVQGVKIFICQLALGPAAKINLLFNDKNLTSGLK